MKCCVSTDVGTWTNWLTFEPDLVHSPNAGTGFTPDFSISARLLKNACMDLDEMLRVVIGTWTNWLTFEPDPDYSPDAGTGLLSPISYALQRKILLRRENPTYRYWAAAMRGFKMVLRPTAAAARGFTMVLFTVSGRNNFVGGTCAVPSALLVVTRRSVRFKHSRQCCRICLL